jgi:PAS domain S-box-containing protein
MSERAASSASARLLSEDNVLLVDPVTWGAREGLRWCGEPAGLIIGAEGALWANEALWRWAGPVLEAWEGKGLRGLDPRLDAALRRVEEGEETRVEAEVLLQRWELSSDSVAELRLVPLLDATGKVVGATFFFMVPRGRFPWLKTTCSEIINTSEADEVLAQVVAGIPHLVWRARDDGTVDFVNQQASLFGGLRSTGAGTWDWCDLVHPADRDRTARSWHQAISTGSPYQCEHRLLLADGTYRWFFSNAVPQLDRHGERRWFGTASDIEREVEAIAALRESERRFRSLADGLPLMVWMHDLEGRQIFVNRTFCRFFGVESGEMVGSRWLELVHPGDREAYQEHFLECLRDRRPFQREVRVRSLDGGHWRHLYSYGQPLLSGESSPMGFIGASVDLTERKAMERELKEARAAAEAANAAKGEFLANMSHEIRTPMTAILGYAEILGNSLADGDDRRCVEIIRRNGNFLLELINDILDLSRIDVGKLEIAPRPLDLLDFLNDLVELLRPKAEEKGLALEVSLIPPLPARVHLDGVRTRQILINLLGNAVKFTNGGTVMLRVRTIDPTGLEFAVEDTGIGIPAEAQRVIFQPFSRLDTGISRVVGGTGLGLAICRRLSAMMNGELRLTSEPGKGSTFFLTLPEVFDATAEMVEEVVCPASRPLPEGGGPARRLTGTYLIVDDRLEVRQLHAYAIEEAGGRVLLAGNGRQALAKWRRVGRKQPWQAVLMDIEMPGMDGLETTRQLRAEGLRCPIIALTAHAMAGDREKCLEAGCDEYLSKPVGTEALVELLWRLTGPEAEATPGPEGTPEAASTEAPLRLLIVEDSESLLRVLQRSFTGEGHEIHLASSFEEAHACAVRVCPHVVLSDLGLPDRNGLELPHALRGLPGLEGVRCVALSGRDGEADQARSLAEGFDTHLVKPPEFAHLRQTVRALGEACARERERLGTSG